MVCIVPCSFYVGSKRDIKLLRILRPKLQERSEFIAGPAQFGPDLGGDARYQVRLRVT